MSRIGKEPVAVPAGVTVKVDGRKVAVKGKLGELSYELPAGIDAKQEGDKIVLTCQDDAKFGNFHGLARALVHNNVVGVSEGYTKQLTIEGTSRPRSRARSLPSRSASPARSSSTSPRGSP